MFQRVDSVDVMVFILWPIPLSMYHPLLSCSKHFPCNVHSSQTPRTACLNMSMSIMIDIYELVKAMHSTGGGGQIDR
jgi:hypothetical protein